MATINEALKNLFVGLGGDPTELADNQTASDYIDDLESAIKACASEASEDILPAVTSEDNGKILAVVIADGNRRTLEQNLALVTDLDIDALDGNTHRTDGIRIA